MNEQIDEGRVKSGFANQAAIFMVLLAGVFFWWAIGTGRMKQWVSAADTRQPTRTEQQTAQVDTFQALVQIGKKPPRIGLITSDDFMCFVTQAGTVRVQIRKYK